MLIAGAGGHARELLFEWELISREPVLFFDDTNKADKQLYGEITIIQSLEEAKTLFRKDNRFILGVGKPSLRQALCIKLEQAGGQPTSLISKSSVIGNREMVLGAGLNIMTGAVLTANIQIGKGTLVHIMASIHHDCRVGEFCELSPGCRLLGKVQLGSFVSVGAGAVILPGIQVGDYAIIGAGAVVSKNIAARQTVAGVPAKPVKQKA